MKKVKTLLAVFLGVVVSYPALSDVSICKEVALEAKFAQTVRQTGVTLGEALKVVQPKELVVHAYLVPEGKTLAEKEEHINMFTQWVFGLCMKEFGQEDK